VLRAQLLEVRAGDVIAQVTDVQLTAHVKLLSLLGLMNPIFTFRVRWRKGPTFRPGR
jgi:hypothetical protein